uniref:Asparagine synthetase [glutamine-hydrolyzing] 1-like n=1 Tax=Nicotiana tabacum TaxID=4097 RepID=A0A1S3Y0F4_TOBAC|nr:PREDICTED: asparagine synthetase [glutamine-hydrolyzing] 1-like [Nicotiana tabacum]
MCGILAVLGCSDDSQAKRARVLELSRRSPPKFASAKPCLVQTITYIKLPTAEAYGTLDMYFLSSSVSGPDSRFGSTFDFISGSGSGSDPGLASSSSSNSASGSSSSISESVVIPLPLHFLRFLLTRLFQTLSVNGEIYNHEQLRKQLPNHKFRTGSDCDVIAHLYEEHREDFVDMLDGMFAFVLLDTRDNSFLIARDAIGIASLYIGWGLDGSVWISSELKGLNDDCEHFEVFPPGHLYSSKNGGFRR